jgi:hypothetical protein
MPFFLSKGSFFDVPNFAFSFFIFKQRTAGSLTGVILVLQIGKLVPRKAAY